MCLDWILASTEYIEFVYMMLEFKVRQLDICYVMCQGAQDWDGEDYQYEAGQAYEYGGEDADEGEGDNA